MPSAEVLDSSASRLLLFDKLDFLGAFTPL